MMALESPLGLARSPNNQGELCRTADSSANALMCRPSARPPFRYLSSLSLLQLFLFTPLDQPLAPAPRDRGRRKRLFEQFGLLPHMDLSGAGRRRRALGPA